MQYRKLTELKKLDNNPRTIKKQDMDKLVESIKNNQDYFEARPLILSNRTGELVILGGNQRYEAAKKLGLKQVPTHLIEGLTEEREREIVIRDNVANGEWDWDILANEWDAEELEDWGLDLPSFADDFSDDFTLDSGEREPFGQMTFMLADIQKSEVEQALKEAPAGFAETYGNENSNGNKLYWIIKQWQQLKKL